MNPRRVSITAATIPMNMSSKVEDLETKYAI